MKKEMQERYGLRSTEIQKVVRVGSYQDDYFKSKLPVFCKIKYADGKLSISGVVAPLSNGDCRGSCGQMYNEIINNLELFDFADGWDKVKAFQFVEYWKQWHLNDMRAGCEHQRAMKWSDERIAVEELPKDTIANSDERVIIATWVRHDEHPNGLLSKPCPTCGYKYGTEWLKEEVPTDVLKWLEALPNSDRMPVWI